MIPPNSPEQAAQSDDPPACAEASTTSLLDSAGAAADAVPAGTRPSLWESAPMAVRMWGRQQWLMAVGVSAIVAAVIGVSTVLIPNDWFSRDIATEPWDYPVWIVMSVLTGMLVATYLRPAGIASANSEPAAAEVSQSSVSSSANEQAGSRPARFGTIGAVLGWFAVGCPVCNKIALLALGYTGALQWFAPAQPFLAGAAILLSAVALLVRLRGQVWCPVTAR